MRRGEGEPVSAKEKKECQKQKQQLSLNAELAQTCSAAAEIAKRMRGARNEE